MRVLKVYITHLHRPILWLSFVLVLDLVHNRHMFRYQDEYVTEMLLNRSSTSLHDSVYVLHFLVYSKTIALKVFDLPRNGKSSATHTVKRESSGMFLICHNHLTTQHMHI